jgi:CheY-like chemotaxis protein
MVVTERRGLRTCAAMAETEFMDRETTHPRIILAEDDGAMRCLMASKFRTAGCEVLEFEDGIGLHDFLQNALRAGGLSPFDVVVSDLRMPGRSGLDVLAALRRSDGATPFVLITAFGDRPTYLEARQLGVTETLDKPLDVDDLVSLVQHLV